MMLAIYLIGMVVVFAGMLYNVREEQDEVSAGDIFAVIFISILWFLILPIAIFIWMLDKFAKLISKGKK